MLKMVGYALLFISCIAWAALPLIPFLSWDAEKLAAIGAGVFIFAEVTWWLAMPLLGKEIFDVVHRWWPQIIAWCKERVRGEKAPAGSGIQKD